MTEQFSLFPTDGIPPENDPAPLGGSRPDTIEPADPAPTHADIASRISPLLRLGTSSWSFPGWGGLVWRKRHDAQSLAKRGLEIYARHPLLSAVGLDRSFYAPVPIADMRLYNEQTPADFRFLVKAPQAVTQSWLRDSPEPNPNFLDAELVTHQWIEPAAIALGAKMGVFLFQFPPLGRRFTQHPKAFCDALDAFLSQLPKGPAYAVEIRDREILTDAYRDALAANGVDHCFNIHPAMPSPTEQASLLPIESQRVFVCRWMLHSGMRYEQARERYAPFDKIVDPDPTSLDTIAGLALAAVGSSKPGIIIINNKAEGSSPLSVFRLSRRIAGI